MYLYKTQSYGPRVWAPQCFYRLQPKPPSVYTIDRFRCFIEPTYAAWSIQSMADTYINMKHYWLEGQELWHEVGADFCSANKSVTNWKIAASWPLPPHNDLFLLLPPPLPPPTSPYRLLFTLLCNYNVKYFTCLYTKHRSSVHCSFLLIIVCILLLCNIKNMERIATGGYRWIIYLLTRRQFHIQLPKRTLQPRYLLPPSGLVFNCSVWYCCNGGFTDRA